MERRNSNYDKCNIKLKGNGAYELHYTGKVYWLCGYCMNGIVKREILTSEPVKDFCDEVGRGTITPKQDFVTPICEEDVVEITGKALLEHKVICKREGALDELDNFKVFLKTIQDVDLVDKKYNISPTICGLIEDKLEQLQVEIKELKK